MPNCSLPRIDACGETSPGSHWFWNDRRNLLPQREFDAVIAERIAGLCISVFCSNGQPPGTVVFRRESLFKQRNRFLFIFSFVDCPKDGWKIWVHTK